MSRLADYFVIVGYDHDDKRKLVNFCTILLYLFVYHTSIFSVIISILCVKSH